MSAKFFIMLSILLPWALLIAAVVNDFRSRHRRPQREGF